MTAAVHPSNLQVPFDIRKIPPYALAFRAVAARTEAAGMFHIPPGMASNHPPKAPPQAMFL